MHELGVFIKLIVACTISYFVKFIDMYGLLIAISIGSMAFDWVTGLIAAFINREVSSEKGHKGLKKKMLLIVFLAFGIFLDWAVPCLIKLVPSNVIITFDSLYIGAGVAVYLSFNEWISIFENFKKGGISFPPWISTTIKIFKSQYKQ